jgi:hypothetical protein
LAALHAVLKALRRAVGRDLMTLWSIRVNNFFLFIALLMYGAAESGLEPKSAEPLLVLTGFLLLFPASNDPLSKIPPSRFSLWPLAVGQKLALRLMSLMLSPVLWIAGGILLKTARLPVSLSFLAVAVTVQVASVAGLGLSRREPAWNPLRHIPQLPGRLGGLIRNNLRELLSVLDPYLALMLSAAGASYRFFYAHPDPNAAPIISILIALALSTYAQSLFGLDFGSGLTRYRLLPLRGWEILLEKDVAFLIVLSVLVAPFQIGTGLTFGLVSLALGHHSSVCLRIPQKRWRFAAGRLLPVGALQAIGSVAAAFGEQSRGAAMLIPAAAIWVASIWFYGRRWENDTDRPV